MLAWNAAPKPSIVPQPSQKCAGCQGSRAPRDAWAPQVLAAALLGHCAQARRGARGTRCVRRSVPLSELLGDIAANWEELEELQSFKLKDDVDASPLEVVAADLSDLDRCMDIVVPVFGVKTEELESVKKGIAMRLGARRSLVGRDAASPRPRMARPIPFESPEIPELGLVLALKDPSELSFVALVDLSLWPNDGRVRAPGAKSKPGVASLPYVLNLCVAPEFRRRGLARRLMKVLERLVRDVWGDAEIYLHVEDEQIAANLLYEALGYVPLKYTYDKDFPYTKAEAQILRNVTWRRKLLPVPSEGSPARSGTVLPEAMVEESDLGDQETEDDEEDEDDEDEEEDEEENAEDEDPKSKDEEEDFDWVAGLMKWRSKESTALSSILASCWEWDGFHKDFSAVAWIKEQMAFACSGCMKCKKLQLGFVKLVRAWWHIFFSHFWHSWWWIKLIGHLNDGYEKSPFWSNGRHTAQGRWSDVKYNKIHFQSASPLCRQWLFDQCSELGQNGVPSCRKSIRKNRWGKP